ncbi:ABC transporter permease [Aetokthonos hydrillicola Thurmond2011]|jgi:membrane protein implicated in regulation of membrane protease activity|uniref:ABC transporter permease n=1 Tax=Aetokthonos hydrillicola Thurmond2011 TaxID=2712845 RepID=A0AAP5IEL3_9CYAN|nr:ABC transporter permease [Aetokthonos hydrillicola]MBO3458090.1 ABC transporter permease [Aetokthonos hydrillicola CCALA 1050]MBW4587074.1 ABC transporter permease [Aetokthonos hydrillicola CCALA 1050]MDR9899677.1 ABC transporter permease [Aetokthonos hydrillicola Thurmond2011]
MGQKIIIFTATFILLITGVLLGYVLSQLVLGFLILNLLTFLGTFSLIVIFGTLYYVLFWEFRRNQSQSLSSGRTTLQRGEVLPDDRLRSRLIAILGGDTAAAERLIQQSKRENPDMPENWHWEKSIAELERDQR